MKFRVLVVGGTGQVGSALVRALLACSDCLEVVMVNRRVVTLDDHTGLRQVVLDVGAATFESDIQSLAASGRAQGDPVFAASCIGIGSGSQTSTGWCANCNPGAIAYADRRSKSTDSCGVYFDNKAILSKRY